MVFARTVAEKVNTDKAMAALTRVAQYGDGSLQAKARKRLAVLAGLIDDDDSGMESINADDF